MDRCLFLLHCMGHSVDCLTHIRDGCICIPTTNNNYNGDAPLTFLSPPTEPAFCFITPISYLNQFATMSNRHLVLAHLVDDSLTYANFYRDRSQAGDYIMMDNSAYELHEPYSPDRLIDLANKCGAHAIVLPDYPFQPAQVTIDAAEEFAPLFKAAGFHTFFVPQSQRGDLDDWLRAYDYAAESDLIDIIGMSILGIPNALPAIDPAYARVVMTSLLKDRGQFACKAHHFLGLNSGVNLEIPSLLRMNALTSVDSSGPVWSAILGHSYTTEADSYQLVSKVKLPVDFSIPLSKDQPTLDRIRNNVDMTNALFTSPQCAPDWFAKH